MKVKTKHYKSPYFRSEQRVLGIFEPQEKSLFNNINLFIYDGHVLDTKIKDLDTNTGIKIDDLVDKHGYRIFALSTMKNIGNIRWSQRVKELNNFKENKWVWNEFVNSILKDLKSEFSGIWIGVGFSLSGRLVFQNQDSLDNIISISPALKGWENLKAKNGIIFFGKNECKKDAQLKYNNPINKFSKNNKIRVIEFENLVHDFHSWRDHFDRIINLSEEHGIFKRHWEKR